MAARGFTLVEILSCWGSEEFLRSCSWAWGASSKRSRAVETVVDIGEMSRRIKQQQVAKGALPGNKGSRDSAVRAREGGVVGPAPEFDP
jgi:hypothetical protein